MKLLQSLFFSLPSAFSCTSDHIFDQAANDKRHVPAPFHSHPSDSLKFPTDTDALSRPQQASAAMQQLLHTPLPRPPSLGPAFQLPQRCSRPCVTAAYSQLCCAQQQHHYQPTAPLSILPALCQHSARHKRKPSRRAQLPAPAAAAAAAASIPAAAGDAGFQLALPQLFPATGPWGVWAGLVVAGAFGMWSERTRLGKELSGALVATLAGEQQQLRQRQ